MCQRFIITGLSRIFQLKIFFVALQHIKSLFDLYVAFEGVVKQTQRPEVLSALGGLTQANQT